MRGVVACVVMLLGCRQILGIEPGRSGDAGIVDDDGQVVDAGACLTISNECVSRDILRTCNVVGAQPVDTQCDWQCGSGTLQTAHCMTLQPAGGAVIAADLLSSTGLVQLALPASDVTINTDSGSISAGATVIRSAGAGIVNGIDFVVRNNVAVFRVNRLEVTGTVAIVGARAGALVAIDSIHIAGSVDVRGPCSSRTAGPGGFAGGASNASATGSGAGGTSPITSVGGGGGGHGGNGGNGGSGVGVGGVSFGTPTIASLSGGGGGGGGSGGAGAGTGGGGGGAIQLAANTLVEVTLSGSINAGGCGGQPGAGGNDGGGGGGAGGTILIEASNVEIAGTLAVNGGGGGESAGTLAGANGRADRIRASGGGIDGGLGAAGGTLTGGSGQGSPGGGGGGGIGRIRINTSSATSLVSMGTLSPNFSDTNTTCTKGIADVQ